LWHSPPELPGHHFRKETAARRGICSQSRKSGLWGFGAFWRAVRGRAECRLIGEESQFDSRDERELVLNVEEVIRENGRSGGRRSAGEWDEPKETRPRTGA
jgi:hypothetical protein